MLYFAQCSATKAIKIGFSRLPESRIKQIQLNSASPIVLLATESSLDDENWKNRNHGYESLIHRRFGHLRLHHEWFSPGPELLEYIAALNREKANV